MYLTRSEYDHGVSTFSPDGRLFQVEYAVSSIKLGSTAIGIQTAEGIVLAVEKVRVLQFLKMNIFSTHFICSNSV
jgi:20S proteasome alpha/beta subunit